MYARVTPNNFPLNSSYFCIPFTYSLIEVNDINGEVNETYLTIEPNNACKEGYSDETLKNLDELKGKKIIRINDVSPYQYLDNMSKKGRVIHSPQARFIYIQRTIAQFSAQYFPFKIEELKVSIKFENVDELFNIDYQFIQKKNLNSEFQMFFQNEQEKCLKYKIPFPTYEEMELKYKIKKGIFKPNLRNKEEDIWDLKSNEGNIKCKVDNNNQLNILYQNSFSPEVLKIMKK